MLEENQVKIGTFTETWLSNDTRDSIKFKGYNLFHSIRENVLRVSGGISIVVDSNIPANRIDLKVPEYLECLWISVGQSGSLEQYQILLSVESTIQVLALYMPRTKVT